MTDKQGIDIEKIKDIGRSIDEVLENENVLNIIYNANRNHADLCTLLEGDPIINLESRSNSSFSPRCEWELVVESKNGKTRVCLVGTCEDDGVIVKKKICL